MPIRGVGLRPVMLIAAVFISLALIHLWLGVEEEPASENVGGQSPTVELTRAGEHVNLSTETLLSLEDLRQLLQERMSRLEGAEPRERLTAAVQLNYMTNDAREQERLLHLDHALTDRLQAALLTGLNDADPVISTNCRDALVGLWRMPPSPGASQSLQQGLNAFDADQPDGAAQAFDSLEKVWGKLPPDLYRLRGEMLLAQSRPERALQECRNAIRAQPHHFLAYYVMAMAYEQTGDHDKALKALEGALTVYKRFPQARELREQILARKAGEEA